MAEDALSRIADALERLSPAPPKTPDLNADWAFTLDHGALKPASPVACPPLALLRGVERQSASLLQNTVRFAQGGPANSALLWGARGVGKSALLKSVCRTVAADHPRLKLLEVGAADLSALGAWIGALRRSAWRVILFLDDLALDADGALVHALKPALDGGLAGANQDVLVYATSNRRHLISRDPAENATDDLFWRDTAEERLAVSDRFGLWLGFHAWGQDTYLSAVRAYAEHFTLSMDDLDGEAIRWALARGARSGRTAWQFIVHRAAQDGRDIGF